MRIVNAQTIVDDAPEWLTRKWTFKRSFALVTFWSMALIVMPIIHLLSQALVGILRGLGDGLIAGVRDSWTDVQKYWRQFEECGE